MAEEQKEEHLSMLKDSNGKPYRHTEFDDILPYIGEFGTYQKLMLLMMAPFAFFYAFVYFTTIFITITPKTFWCLVPELMNLTSDLRRNLSIPLEGTEYSSCTRYEANWIQVVELGYVADGTNMTSCDQGWEFQYTDIPYPTASTEIASVTVSQSNEREKTSSSIFGWVCDKKSYPATTQSIFFAGSIIGGVVFGYIADKYGRIPALVGCNILGCIGGVLTVFSTGFWDFAVYRMLVGMSYDNCFMLVYVLVLEYVGLKYRSLVANLPIAYFFGVACVLMPWLALWIADWRKLTLYTHVPMVIAILAPFLMPESARWLVSKGKTKKTVKILNKFERVNKMKIPEDVLQDFIVTTKRSIQSDESAFKLLQRPILRRMTLYLIFMFISCATVFDGLVRLSDTLGLDFFLTFSLSAATEIPSVTLAAFIMDKYGRRMLSCGPLLISGTCCFIALFVPSGAPTVSLAVIARFFVNMAYNAVIQWATELFPTPTRASGSSLLHISGYIAVMVTPFIVYLGKFMAPLPLLTLGAVSVLGGMTSLLLPETMGREMPQTFEDGENLMNEHTIFSFRSKMPKKRNNDEVKT